MRGRHATVLNRLPLRRTHRGKGRLLGQRRKIVIRSSLETDSPRMKYDEPVHSFQQFRLMGDDDFRLPRIKFGHLSLHPGFCLRIERAGAVIQQ